MTLPTSVIRAHQRAWAKGRGIAFDGDGYTLTLDGNLFSPLSSDTRREFAEGDGSELGTADRRGKIQALHSSSALACNVFDYWRHREPSVLAQALTASIGIGGVKFEQKRPTGLPGHPPNLDMVLALSDGSELAIESKFLEPYSGHHSTGFKRKYFESTDGEWKRHGYSACQNLAESLYSGNNAFRWLNVEQLLKHILGLARGGKPWHLLYLWYAPDCPETHEHAVEVRSFTEIVGGDGIRFSSKTYQDLFASMKSRAHDGHAAYFHYLESRYFLRYDMP